MGLLLRILTGRPPAFQPDLVLTTRHNQASGPEECAPATCLHVKESKRSMHSLFFLFQGSDFLLLESSLLKKIYIHIIQFLLWISKESLYSVQICGNSWRAEAKNKALQLFVVWDGRKRRRLCEEQKDGGGRNEMEWRNSPDFSSNLGTPSFLYLFSGTLQWPTPPFSVLI